MINTGNLIFFLRARLREDLARTRAPMARAAIERKIAIVDEFAELHHDEKRLTDTLVEARYSWLLHNTILGLAKAYARHDDYGKWET